jgi:hypothetical protein
MKSILVYFLATAGAGAEAFIWPVQVDSTDRSLTLHNGYVSVTYSDIDSSLTMGADFHGQGDYTDVLAAPYKLHVKLADGHTYSNSYAIQDPMLLEKTDDIAVLKIPGILTFAGTGSESMPLVAEDWTLTLARASRSIRLDIDGVAVRDAVDVAAVFHGLYMKSPSINGLFDNRGMAQMMNKTNGCQGSDQAMSRAYTMGGGVAMDYIRHTTTESSYSNDQPQALSPRQIVLSTARNDGYATGIEDLVLGSYPELSLSYDKAWGACWGEEDLVATPISIGTQYSVSVSFVPNDYDFPAYLLRDILARPIMPFTDIRTFMTGIYGSPAGCLQGYYENHEGTIAPTISHPDVGYSPDTNFFDPDNFIALSALMYSGDAFLLEETRRVLERTSNTMCGIGSEQVDAYCNGPRMSAQKLTTASSIRFGTPSPKLSKQSQSLRGGIAPPSLSAPVTQGGREGQLMHHFVQLVPTYESIAGSEQLGPNVFWTWTCLRYISLTQDLDWAVKMFPYLDLSIKYLLTFYDEEKGMIFAPGPLWIDVLVRENYTSDSNAVMVPFLQLAADAYESLGPLMAGESESGEYIIFAKELRKISVTIAVTMSTDLWDADSNDHFITQLDPSGHTRDFVDYDSNLLAVAFGAVSLGAQGDNEAALKRMNAILGRVDAGDYTHVRATWCSEIPYSGDAQDCYIVGGSVCGDSVVTLARIGWADAHARKLVGDIDTFDSLLLSPLQEDLISDVWLYERYNASGDQIRTAFYFEYPSLVSMMLREIRYGISIGLNRIDIDPFMASVNKEFEYSFGDTLVVYSEKRVELRVPGVGKSTSKLVTIHGMKASASYALISWCKHEPNDNNEVIYVTDELGLLKFDWTFKNSECSLIILLKKDYY